MSYDAPPGYPPADTDIWWRISFDWSPPDVYYVHIENTSSNEETGFENVAHMLTDGTPQSFSLNFWGDDMLFCTSLIRGESDKFAWWLPEPVPGPDFVGCTIDDIMMNPSSMMMQWEDGTWRLPVSLEIYGEVVPVPGAALLGTIGLGVAGWRLRRREMA